jgi:hypothetical protein
MAIDLGNPTWITLVADSGTPPELAQYAGIRILWPEGRPLPPMARPDTLIVLGVQLPGYAREGSGGIEWVMTPAGDPVTQALDAIPAPDPWAAPTAKAVYQNIGSALLAKGFTLSEARVGLTQLYQAAVSNHVANHPGT